MAEKKSREGFGTGEDRVPKTSVRVNGGPIESAAQSFDGVSWEKGYKRTSILNINRNAENDKVTGVEKP